MNYSIVATSNFRRGLKKLSDIDKQRLQRLIEEITADPYTFKELAGKFRQIRSTRFGDHRVIYSVNEIAKEILLLAVEQRGSVYNR